VLWDSYKSIRGVSPESLTLLEDYSELAEVTFGTYQEACTGTAIYDGSLAVVYPAMGLANEAGEVLGKVKKKLRDGGDYNVADLKAEIGDVLWYMAALCTDLDIDLEDVALSNLDKLQSRMDRDVLGGSGDYR
jgi:NTP pyrophosphatase (non-canonical NTP hydrolase)